MSITHIQTHSHTIVHLKDLLCGTKHSLGKIMWNLEMSALLKQWTHRGFKAYRGCKAFPTELRRDGALSVFNSTVIVSPAGWLAGWLY